MEAVVTYQNNALKKEIGSWKGEKLKSLLDRVSDGEGERLLSKLINDGNLSLSAQINNIEIKFHSRKSETHFQMAITDNTEIIELRDIAQQSQIVNSFLDIGAHELATPLSSIMGFTHFLLDEEFNQVLNNDQRHMLNSIEKSTKKLQNVVTNMLDLVYANDTSRLNSEKKSLINIGEFITDMLPLLKITLEKNSFNEKNLKLDDSFYISISKQKLHDLCSEIAINLRRNTPPGKNITIQAFDEEESVHIIVENECFGIPTNELDKIFEPFHRHQDSIHHSSGYEYDQGGPGIGLTITKKIINDANGKIWVVNKKPYSRKKENTVQMHIIFPKSFSPVTS